MNLILGIDTGGSYTDGVIIDRESGQILEKAKALTTKSDYCIGIKNCLNKMTEESLRKVRVVCLSTTLATNAIVEGKGCKTTLIVLGKMPKGKLPGAKVYLLDGLLNIQGKIVKDIDLNRVDDIILELGEDMESVVVSGYASVRNPDHEIRVRERIQRQKDVPVVCAHEISGTLGYYERTVTAVLNGQLVPILKKLVRDTKWILHEKGVEAPVMVVKGDGTFISAEMAQNRPIDTLLSGPAASVVGAVYLSGVEDAVIMDMGGTTTDVCLLQNGKVVVTSEGACVAGWHTRVKAIDIYTKGLGGDSIITIDESKNIRFGPEKVIPVCLDAMEIKEFKGRRVGFTPTDMAHVKGIYTKWNAEKSNNWLGEKATELGVDSETLYQNLEKAFFNDIHKTLLESGKFSEGETIIGIGAPVVTWMPLVSKKRGLDVVVPEHSEVASAVGAAMGNVEESTEVIIRLDSLTGNYVGYAQWARMEFDTLDEAKSHCLKQAKRWLKSQAEMSGCAVPNIIVETEDIYCERYGITEKAHVETRIRLVAVGVPVLIKTNKQ